MSELVTITLPMAEKHVIFRYPFRHIYIGNSGAKERWIDTAREDVSYEFNMGNLIVTAPKSYLMEKGLVD